MDWLRLQRALEVGRIVDIEAKNALYLAGKLKADALNSGEWRAIQDHDRLYEQWEAERDSTHGGAVDGE